MKKITKTFEIWVYDPNDPNEIDAETAEDLAVLRQFPVLNAFSDQFLVFLWVAYSDSLSAGWMIVKEGSGAELWRWLNTKYDPSHGQRIIGDFE